MFESDFKRDFSFHKRFEESAKVINQYPDRRPIICEKAFENVSPTIDKKKYLVPCDLNVGQFMYVIRKRLKLLPEEAIFLFVNNRIISGTSIIGTIYDNYKDADGFLYIQYAKENVYG